MRAIISINAAGYIGLNNALVSPNAADLRHFRRLTMQSHKGNDMPMLLAGWRTIQTLPQLVGRRVYCDVRGDKLHPYLHLFDWCIGGKATYEKYAPYFEELHISHIADNTIGDVTAPDFESLLNADCKVFHYNF
jgi:dihydrofolate reductase